MSEAQLIWRFGRWVAGRPHGSVTLEWPGGHVVLRIAGGRIVGVEGLEVGAVSGAPESPDVLKEAVAAARRRGLSETDGVAIVKEAIEEALCAWLASPQRRLEIVDEAPAEWSGPTISLSHAIVEAILVRESDGLPEAILPDLRVMLRRTPGFLEQYASLQLNEEADLIAAKITGQRTAEQLVERSPYNREEVLRLLAALVAAGLLEPVPVATPDNELSDDLVLATSIMEEESNARRFPLWWIAAGVLAFLALAAGAIVLFHNSADAPAADSRTWGVVVDRGCEPQDLQRILSKAGRFPDTVRAERTDSGSNAPCWQLVWGSFPDKEKAEEAVGNAPRSLLHEGIEPVVIPLEPLPPPPEEDTEEQP